MFYLSKTSSILSCTFSFRKMFRMLKTKSMLRRSRFAIKVRKNRSKKNKISQKHIKKFMRHKKKRKKNFALRLFAKCDCDNKWIFWTNKQKMSSRSRWIKSKKLKNAKNKNFFFFEFQRSKVTFEVLNLKCFWWIFW